MKAITIWQPWASLLACGAKKFETRSRETSYRGPIVIHAAKKPIVNILRDLPQKIIDMMGLALSSAPGTGHYGAKDLLGLPLGSVIATAELVGCHLMRQNQEDGSIYIKDDSRMWAHEVFPGVKDNEYLFGDWTPGRYAWEFENMQMLPEPISARGKQRLWEWEGTR